MAERRSISLCMHIAKYIEWNLQGRAVVCEKLVSYVVLNDNVDSELDRTSNFILGSRTTRTHGRASVCVCLCVLVMMPPVWFSTARNILHCMHWTTRLTKTVQEDLFMALHNTLLQASPLFQYRSNRVYKNYSTACRQAWPAVVSTVVYSSQSN
jgi:hypothetical protein